MLRHASELSPRSSLITFWETSVAGAFSPGDRGGKRFCRTAPTAFASLQPATQAGGGVVSPPPRAAALPRASRFPSMKVLAGEVEKPASPQFDVPEVIPNVCVPKVPFVVAARTWIIPAWSPKIIEPRPHPAVP